MNIIFISPDAVVGDVGKNISHDNLNNSEKAPDSKEMLISNYNMPSDIDKIYISSQLKNHKLKTFINEKFPKTEIVLNEKINDVNFSKLSADVGSQTLINMINEKNVDGYFTHFGQYGENRFDVETRLATFITDTINNNFFNNTIVIMANSFIVLLLKHILKLSSLNDPVLMLEKFDNVSFSSLNRFVRTLNHVKNTEIKYRASLVENLNVRKQLKNNIFKIAKKEFNNIEFSTTDFEKFISGLKTDKLIQKNKVTLNNEVTVICFYNNFENFVNKWMEHYISIGVKNYVMIDNNSTDNSTEILKSYNGKVNIAFWEINERYECNKMCGWRQQLLEFYGVNKLYLTVDSDELLIYKNYKTTTTDTFVNDLKSSQLKGMMIDVYTKDLIANSTLNDFVYADKNTYKKSINNFYGERCYGGPRERLFGIRPSLQKMPVMYYTGKEVFANDHFYYPWNINKKAKLKVFLLHYKFLPGDLKKYREFANDGRHWNNSQEYKVYNNILTNNDNASFYDENCSVHIDDLPFLK